VRQRGGFLGLDRKVQVDGNLVRITEKGATRRVHPLGAAEVARVRDLVTRVARVSEQAVQHRSELPSDVLATKIAIEDGPHRKILTVRTGDSAPDEVWELIGVLDRFTVAD
jgi:hypothetical protein